MPFVQTAVTVLVSIGLLLLLAGIGHLMPWHHEGPTAPPAAATGTPPPESVPKGSPAANGTHLLSLPSQAPAKVPHVCLEECGKHGKGHGHGHKG